VTGKTPHGNLAEMQIMEIIEQERLQKLWNVKKL